MSEVIEAMCKHLMPMAEKRDKGFVYVTTMPRQYPPMIVTSLGMEPFGLVEFCEPTQINIRMQLPAKLCDPLGIKLPRYGRKRHKPRKLIRDLFRLGHHQPFHAHAVRWPTQYIDLFAPDSVTMSEYFINKMITLANRSIKRNNGAAHLSPKFEELPCLLTMVRAEYKSKVLDKRRKLGKV